MATSAISVSIQGLPELLKRFEKASVDIQERTAAALEDGAKAIQENAKALAPVNFGFLKNLITIFPPRDGGLTWEIASLANYSAYVEFGTGTHVDVPTDPEGLPEYALQFKGHHSIPGMFARPFFFEAFRHQRVAIIKDIQKQLEKTLQG